ncbi:MAG: helix-turn-helix transcriptional regulator [Phycisphaeraceae bacterium]
MTHATTISIKHEPFVLLPQREYEELLARAAGETLPPLPPANARGHRPAREAVRVVIARNIITSRIKAGWTQQELARRAKVSVETISRLESAKHKPQAATLQRIDAAFNKAGV